MDTYLDGYGEDYGESSHVLDPPKLGEKKKKKKRSNKKKKSSKQKQSGAKKSKAKKKTDEGDTSGDLVADNPPATLEGEAEVKDSPIAFEVGVGEITNAHEQMEEIDLADESQDHPALSDQEHHSKSKKIPVSKSQQEQLRAISGTPRHDEVSRSNDSIDANAEYESLTSVSSEVVFKEEIHKAENEGKQGSSNVDLPLAVEHYTEGVKRLQKSAQEYEEQRFGKVFINSCCM